MDISSNVARMEKGYTPEVGNSSGGSIHDSAVRYWDERSRGYSLATRISLNNRDDDVRRIIEECIPDNRRLRVLDIGTGAGYAAIIMAQMGHEVVAVDYSEKMLEKARSNARQFRVDIMFIQGDIEELDLDPFSFDVIVAKDVVWSLVFPARTYNDWIHLLKSGGYLLIIDGNYYLDLYDEDYAKRRNYIDMKNGADSNLHAMTNMDEVNLNRIREIAKLLPLSHERRPSWDMAMMLGMGLVDIRVKLLDSNPYALLTRDGMMKLPFRFMILARMPYENHATSDYDYVHNEMMTRLSERLLDADTGAVPMFKALADPKRLKIVMALYEGRMNVSQLSDVIGESASLVSHNLKLLKDGNVVRSSREGKEIFYRLTDRVAVGELMTLCTAMLQVRNP